MKKDTMRKIEAQVLVVLAVMDCVIVAVSVLIALALNKYVSMNENVSGSLVWFFLLFVLIAGTVLNMKVQDKLTDKLMEKYL